MIGWTSTTTAIPAAHSGSKLCCRQRRCARLPCASTVGVRRHRRTSGASATPKSHRAARGSRAVRHRRGQSRAAVPVLRAARGRHRCRLVDLVNRLAYSSIGEDLTARAVRLSANRPPGGCRRAHRRYAGVHMVLDRAADGGLPLTAAGAIRSRLMFRRRLRWCR